LKKSLSDVNLEKYKKLKVYDTVAFLNDMVLPKALVKAKKSKIALHSVCALEKLKIEYKLVNIANHFADEVILPKNNGCCGMAGDRGFLFPELTESATKKEKEELENQSCDAYYSSTKTCEMAMSHDFGVDYHSILYLVDECI
jgi:D-lactate dehydrogenase